MMLSPVLRPLAPAPTGSLSKAAGTPAGKLSSAPGADPVENYVPSNLPAPAESSKAAPQITKALDCSFPSKRFESQPAAQASDHSNWLLSGMIGGAVVGATVPLPNPSGFTPWFSGAMLEWPKETVNS